MRIEEYNVALSSENLSLKYVRNSSKVRTYRAPSTMEVTVHEKAPMIDEKTLNKIKILKVMLEKLTGKKLKIYLPGPQYEISVTKKDAQDITEIESETETLNIQYSNFSASGQVRTKEGKIIDFSVQLSLFQLSYSYEKVYGKVVDPLILDLKTPNGKKQLVEIDLNFDGELDKFYIGGGRGLLVYDKNGNGKVDDATELLGPVTKDGFSELAKLDSDGDNWIDEDDLEFLKLKIWTTDENGKEKLVGLLDLNVGAIFLGSVTTPFDYYDSVVRRTGIYLTEDGNVGTVRQFDFKV